MVEEEARSEAGGEDHGRRAYPVVGIGASPGGADALRGLLGALDGSRVAVVVVEHGGDGLEPVLRALVGDRLVPIADGVAVDRDRVYLAPAGAEVAIFHGVFHVMPPAAPTRGAARLPIDFFLSALAADQGTSAIGVVLGGTAPDGAFGLESIKAEGGLTFIQSDAAGGARGEVRTPGAAIHADFALGPTGIAAEIDAISRHPYLTALPGASVVRPAPGNVPARNDELGKLFVLIRSAFGTDLSFYKRSTIARRVERRMIVARVDRLEDYVRYVQTHPAELDALYKDCLIGVTSFFRDPATFEALQATVLPRLLERKRPNLPLRAWIPGCATGEEAYSIAMCMLECLDGKDHDAKLQIFATDLDADAIHFARRGLYPASIAQDVSPARLARFFMRIDGEYQISRRIRDLVVFAVQDVTRGPPFSHVDLISCRNVLIYLQPSVQKKVLRIFHYALNPEGALLLGSSETIGESADIFSVADKQNRIYYKKNTPSAAVFDVTFAPPHARRIEAPPQPPGEVRPIVTLQQQADRKVLEKYGPPGVLVNENLEILQFRGRIGGFLEPMPGIATLNLLKLARPELLVELRTAVNKAMTENVPVTVRGIELRSGDRAAVNIEVLPLQDPETRSRCLLVLFETDDPTRPAEPSPAPGDGPEHDRARELERELLATKEYLQQTIEELESSNEELKSSNEELQSSNEELQSTNEELETSKEELQSTNEELNTVNDELQSRMGELTLANDDLVNLLGSTVDPILIVGIDLKIRRMTLAAERLLNLVPADVGRPVAHLKSFFGGVDLEPAILAAIEAIAERREEALGADGRWYRARIVPYRTADKAIRGALLFFADIDAQRRGAGARPPLPVDGVAAMAALPVALVAVDRNQRVVWANRAFYTFFRTDEPHTIGNLLGNLGNGQWAHPKLRAEIARALGENAPFRGFRIDHDFEDIGRRSVLVSGAAVATADGAPLAIVAIDEEPPRA